MSRTGQPAVSSAIFAALTGAATLTLLVVAILAAPAHAISNAFTYQGQLKKDGVPRNGLTNFEFALYDAQTGGNLVASAISQGLTVTNGLFTTQLDFGAVFNGNARWLEIKAAASGDALVLLTPRQEIRSVPYAVRSGFAESGNTGSQWINDPGGIHYIAGNVAIGQNADLILSQQFVVNAGTAAAVPGTFRNNNANFVALNVRNDAVNGIGVYDDASDRHILTGRLGVGTLTTSEAQLTVNPVGTSIGIKSFGTAGPGPSAAVWGIGFGTQILGDCAGVTGQSDYGHGIEGIASHLAFNGGYFVNSAGGTALFADGLAKVKTLQILGGADLVEGFDTKTDAARAPGTVVVIDEKNAGGLRESDAPYDRKVAGVVSGAGGVEAGIRLGQEGKLDGETLVAMTGRVYVKCSNENGTISPGDLLTTSATSGHAMRATDHQRAGGAVIGKAMSSLDSRTGLVLVLVNLQ